MSSIANATVNPIDLKDDSQLDSFGRLRISMPSSLVDTTFQYNDSPIYWQTSITGNASTNHIPIQACINMTVDTSANSKAIRQTYEYYRYQPGRSQQVLMTGVLGNIKPNVIKRVGLFDASNGLFFEVDGSSLSVVQRSHVTGTTIDTKITQDNWNVDKMNGVKDNYNVSGFNIDASLAQIFVIDFQWLGVGRVRYGFNLNGQTFYCHQIDNSNANPNVYMTTANLPLRYEIFNKADTSSNSSMKQICSTVLTEGGNTEALGTERSINNGITLKTASTSGLSIISIRPKLTFNGIINRALIIPESISIHTSADAMYEIVYDASLSNSGWTSIDNNSVVEYDTSTNIITGGIIIDSGYIQTGNTIVNLDLNIRNRLPLTLDITGTKSKNLTIKIYGIGGNTNAQAAIKFREQF